MSVTDPEPEATTSRFDIANFSSAPDANHSRYERRLNDLRESGVDTACIEKAVTGAIDNIRNGRIQSFVIYGEPQSGKTEMMIALAAHLLDDGHRIIIVIMNDSVQLLEQNLDRFLRSGLDPAPKKFNEILDPSIDVGGSPWVIFCKKNSADLNKLLEKIERYPSKIVIDDEADYATPNAKINKNEQTKINELVERLLHNNGIYIGVTATPARLDLNNTFDNDSEKWIDFPPHSYYTGQEIFFPTTKAGLADLGFNLELLPDQGDDPRHIRKAFFSFLINVGYLNTQINSHSQNYCMLVHTSGKRVDHTLDYQQIMSLLASLRKSSSKDFERYVREMWTLAQGRYPDLETSLTQYVLERINQSDVVVMNSNTERNAAQYKRATSPATLFTIAIGGNIVSRGVTFDNLLSMFFTRDVRHKIQQDTYIQRARMFGSRGRYLRYFELSIPGKLYFDWQKCFVFHRLALASIREGKGSPIWIEDKRIAATAAGSIDQAAVALDSGEMSWEIFTYEDALDDVVERGRSGDPLAALREIAEIVGESSLPRHVVDFIAGFDVTANSVAIHETAGVYGTPIEQREIRRARGFIGSNQLERGRFPTAVHHVKMYRNEAGQSRVFYKYTPEVGSIRFLRNIGRRSRR
jgi:hypothetical protein